MVITDKNPPTIFIGILTPLASLEDLEMAASLMASGEMSFQAPTSQLKWKLASQTLMVQR